MLGSRGKVGKFNQFPTRIPIVIIIVIIIMGQEADESVDGRAQVSRKCSLHALADKLYVVGGAGVRATAKKGRPLLYKCNQVAFTETRNTIMDTKG